LPGTPGISGADGWPGFTGPQGIKGFQGEDCGVCAPGKKLITTYNKEYLRK